jgi:SAM-dependent methyltransferase
MHRRPRAARVAERLVLNAVAPVVGRLRGRGPLGLDGDPDRVAAALGWLTPPLEALDHAIHGAEVLELGPGKTAELLTSFVLAGAERGRGLDVSLDLPGHGFSPTRLRATAAMLERRGGGFLAAVGSSPDVVRRRLDEVLAAERVPLEVRHYDGHSVPLPDDSIDLIVSRSVLEHVARSSVQPLVAELRRVLREGGSMVHVIDMRDHMHLVPDPSAGGPSSAGVRGDWLEALTYPTWLYDAMFSRSEAWINRLRIDSWLALFKTAGFQIVHREDHRLELPSSVTTGALREPWRSLDADALSVAQVVVGLR